MAQETPMELDAIESPSADHSGRLPGDAALRKAGFEIYARPRRGPDVWCRREWSRDAKRHIVFFYTEQQAHATQ